MEAMRNARRILVRDLRRLVRSPLAFLIVVGACLLPSAYAWYCIAANWNPYEHTEAIAVAVVNLDEGALVEIPEGASNDSKTIDAGARIITRLQENDQLGWRFPSYDEAMEGVYSGEFFAAIVIPPNFSEDLASIATGSFTRPQLEYYVNEKISAVAPKMIDTGATQIEDEINQQFVGTVSTVVIEVAQQIGASTQAQANEAATTLAERTEQALTNLRHAEEAAAYQDKALADAQKLIDSARESLESARGDLALADGDTQTALDLIESIERHLTQTAGEAEDDIGPNEPAKPGDEGEGEASDDNAIDDPVDDNGINSELDEPIELLLTSPTNGLTSLGAAYGMASSTNDLLDPAIAQAESTLDLVDNLLAQAKTANSDSAAFLEQASSALDGALKHLKTLQNSALAQDFAQLLSLNAQSFGNFLASPVALETHVVFPVGNYGSGVTPFYVNLALWVTGFVLLALIRIRVDDENPERPKDVPAASAYFGRLGLLLVFGLFSSFIICIGCLVMGVQCVSPPAFVAAGLVAGVVYVNVIFALCHRLRHFGRAAAVVLLIMQIPGSSGMYPVEMMPMFFQVIHPLLPFTHSIAAMREAIAGFSGMTYFAELGWLLLFLPISLFIGLRSSRHLGTFGAAFDRALSESSIFEAEPPENRSRRERS